jgi:hypothetical protein
MGCDGYLIEPDKPPRFTSYCYMCGGSVEQGEAGHMDCVRAAKQRYGDHYTGLPVIWDIDNVEFR